MTTVSVIRKGQITLPKAVRQHLGIHSGSEVELSIVGDHVELRVKPAADSASGFGMLKSRRRAVPADFDPAGMLRK
jgi:AbrB family looped-hinge helix DNA binding protein